MLLTVVFSALLCTVLGLPYQAVEPSPKIELEEVVFTLYTRNNGANGKRLIVGDRANLAASGFNAANPTKIATHGFMSSNGASSIQWPKNAFLALGDMNVIGVEWSACAENLQYEITIKCAPQVGAHIATLIKFLKNETGHGFDQVHLLGHSLGGQVVSFVSGNLDGGKVSRLTAMDPAGPLFDHETPDHRLDPEDAVIVDVLHTYTPLLGITNPVGHYDFYPNGGIVQPGCTITSTSCSHGAAISYFVHTIPLNQRNDYMSIKCDQVEDAKAGNCTGSLAPLGYGALDFEPGIYYINMTALMDHVEPLDWQN